MSLVNWKYLLLGFILFRVFDIWKPFPVRRLEKLPGGWGVMADDWMAGVYAAILLRLALHFNLV
jgi:phosphatidylglycerophosphatase A